MDLSRMCGSERMGAEHSDLVEAMRGLFPGHEQAQLMYVCDDTSTLDHLHDRAVLESSGLDAVWTTHACEADIMGRPYGKGEEDELKERLDKKREREERAAAEEA